MSYIPAINLRANLTIASVAATWDVDDGTGDMYVGYPYRWNVRINCDAQFHSSHLTRIPGLYTADDIKVGQWVASQLYGFAWQIIQIDSQNDTYVDCIIEDIERVNLFNDNLSGGGPPIDGEALVFELDENGIPNLTSLPPNMFDPTYFGDLLSRFSRRNLRGSFTRINQVEHGLVIGDMIHLDSDGLFKTVAADAANKNNLGKIVGQVTDVTGPDWFNYKPRGEVRFNIALPEDSVPGQLIYLDPSVPGKLTATRPTKLATPMYIRLQDATTGIYMGAGSGGGAVDEDELRFATVYRVDNIAARDALDITKLKQGDQAYVSDAGNGEWSLFLVSSKTTDPLAVSWTKLVDFDSSTVDGRTVGVEFTFTQTVPMDLYRISPLDRVTVVTVEVLEAFHISADLSIGDDADNERLAESQHIDLSTLGTYTITPSYQYGGTEESMIRAYPNPGTSTSGRVKVTISYI